MRQKRAKIYRKLMGVYSITFGFRQPYQILVDSEMCKTAIDLKIELLKQLGNVLQGEIRPMITQCCIHELYLQGKQQQPAVDLAKTFERRKCNHREPIPGEDCIASVVGEANKHRYVITTQSQPLRAKLRTIPAVPIVHINRTVMVLEPPSDMTLRAKEMTEEKALHSTAPEQALISATSSTEPVRKRKKGPKGPNPLSVKKKITSAPIKDKGTSGKGVAHLATMGDKVKAGEKRKRETDGVEEDQEQSPNRDNLTTEITPKKKRRRKKATAISNTESTNK